MIKGEAANAVKSEAGAAPLVQSVMFSADGFRALFDDNPYNGWDQLRATIDLLEFANAYVLNDRTIMAGDVLGEQWRHRDFLSDFITTEVKDAGTIALLGSLPPGERSPLVYDVAPYYEAAGMPTLTTEFSRLWELEKDARRTGSDAWAVRHEMQIVGNRSRIRQMQSYMLFADSLAADTIPEYEFGPQAIQEYPSFLAERGKVAKRKAIHEHFQELSDEIVRRLAKPVEYNRLELLRQPCFLVEALRSVDTVSGLGHVLQDMRIGDAATSYRELNRKRLYASSINEQRQADEELRRTVSESFKRDGLETRIPSLVKIVAALSALGVQFFFPQLEHLGDIVGVGLETLEVAGRYLRERRCSFVGLFSDKSGTIHSELRAKFPNIAYSEEELAEQLQRRKDALRLLLQV